jgi:hypothetical protein
MEDYGWDSEAMEAFGDLDDWYSGEDYDYDGAEFAGPALGLAARRSLTGRRPVRRPVPTGTGRSYTPPVVSRGPVQQQQFSGALKRVEEDVKRINAGIKTLEARLDSYNTQLASLQRRSGAALSGALFRSNLRAPDTRSGNMGFYLLFGGVARIITPDLTKERRCRFRADLDCFPTTPRSSPTVWP